jgi:uridine phosphorylase
VTNALVDSLKDREVPYRAGVGFCRDAYYVQDQQLNEMLTASGVLAAEQEASTLFIVGSVRGVKTGAIVSTDSNIWLKTQPTTEQKEQLYREGEHLVIQTALDAIVRLYAQGAHRF